MLKLTGIHHKTTPQFDAINPKISDVLIHAISINSGYTSRIMVFHIIMHHYYLPLSNVQECQLTAIIIYTSPFTSIAQLHNIHQQQYADDTQLYIALSAQSLPQSLLSLENCLFTFGPGSVITVWLSTQIKRTRFSSALAIHLVLYPLSHMSMLLAPQYICQKKVKKFGATLDQQLTFHDHINTVCSASIYHLRSFRHGRPALTQDMAKTLGSAVIGAKLDYANFILQGTSSANIK